MSVTVYSTPSCGYCTMAKNYLRSKGIPYTDVNVAADRAKAEEMVRKTNQYGVPVLEINGSIVVGFDRPRIDALIGR
ncbi:MAG: glutaredoxin domain-containing protein [Spirochaetota bacterium]|mgnify:CR=1 FL=1